MTTHKLPPSLTYSNAQRHRHTLLLFVTIAAGVFLRFWQLPSLPPGFHFDEAFEGLEAWRILTDASYRPIFLTGNFGVPPLNAYVNALTFGLWQSLSWPVGPLAMRTTAAGIGILGIIALWALGHELGHPTRRLLRVSTLFPFWGAWILATMRWHIHFSRMGIEPIFVPLIWVAATALLLHGWRTGRLTAFAGCGVILAAGMYAYQGAWIIPFLVAGTAASLLIAHRSLLAESSIVMAHLRRPLFGVLCTLLVATLLVLPLMLFFLHNLDLVFLRPAQLSIVGTTTSPADSNVLASLWATAKMFGPWGMPGDADPRRNLPGAPALDIWYAFSFYLGSVVLLWRLKQPGAQIILLGLLGLLLPGVVSEYAPHFHRILGATAPTALICALGMDWLWQWQASRYKFGGLALVQWLVILILMTGTVRESYNYFVRWAALPDLFHAFDVGLWQIGQQIAAQPADTPIYLTPRDTNHATLAFAWATRPNGHQAPITFDGRQIFPLTAGINAQGETYIAIEHEDFRTPLLWPSLFANGPVVDQIVDSNGAIYAQTYFRPPQTPISRQPHFFLHEDKTSELLGDGIALLGYDVQPAPLTANQILYLQLYWQVQAQPKADWTVFTHLLQRESDGRFTLVTGYDGQPGGGSLPTTHWQPQWLILDEYQLPLPTTVEAGTYFLATGLYQPSGEHLPAPDQGSNGSIILGTVEIE